MDYIKYLSDFSKRHEDHLLVYLHSMAINVIRAGEAVGDTDEDSLISRVMGWVVDEFPENEDLEDYSTAMVKMYSNIGKTRDVLREIAADKLDTNIELVNEEMLEKVKSMGGAYNVNVKQAKDWDEYYYRITVETASNSKCMSRKIGAILVKDKVIISAGYNGPSRGIAPCDQRWFIDEEFIKRHGKREPDECMGKCPRYILGAKSGEMLDECLAMHAEENAIITCARRGIKAKGATMYMTCGIPCFRCMSKIINAGIAELVVASTSLYDDKTMYLLNNSGVKVRLYNFI